MNRYLFILSFLLLAFAGTTQARGVIRVNQLGYLPDDIKVAVFLSPEGDLPQEFELVNSLTGKTVYMGQPELADGKPWGMPSAARLNFSSYTRPGGYFLRIGKLESPQFSISEHVYDGTADYILKYMRQQRCGFNPFLDDSCHTHDGIIVDHPTRSGEFINVTGGWHDATDYLQYVTTSANAVAQMLFAYRENPEVYGDHYKANGLPGSNGVPDILDEARWGIDWLLKMNPSDNVMFNQIADDRDHIGFRLPDKDTANYGLGKCRPVYFVTGKPQGLGEFKNRTTGVASTAGKFASAFALAADIYKKSDPAFADTLIRKAKAAFQFGVSEPGACQTACYVSPYFYEEDNYVDDLELAAAALNEATGKKKYLQDAAYWGKLEAVTPWMELNRARHYQFYPFMNLGHVYLAAHGDSAQAKVFAADLKQGLADIYARAKKDPFLIGIPFIWCSNNLVTAAATQARLYRQITGDQTYREMEAALRDWLFGCNPWGTSMVVGLPAGGDYPVNPHSSYKVILGKLTYGGLVDGPVYTSIYNNLRGIRLLHNDDYAAFQNGRAVYHDDEGDYSTNEPTMDGTASLSYLLSSLQKEGMKSKTYENVKKIQGGIVRMDSLKSNVYLVFSAHDNNDGGKTIEKILRRNHVKASFFFTGDFYRNPENRKLIERLREDGQYLGPHSDKHLLYADWTQRDSLLVTRDEFTDDLRNNIKAMEAAGIPAKEVTTFMPPYEWYNRAIADWSRDLGLTLVDFTPGIRTNADYTTPDMKNYRSSDQLYNDLVKFDQSNPGGLNGCIILIHLGTSPDRKDKFYEQLGKVIHFLKENNYQPNRF